jgi:hypothetical protein
MSMHPKTRSLVAVKLMATCLTCCLAGNAMAAISWDGGGNSNWWFDVQNWSQSANNYLPPAQDSGGVPTFTDAQVNIGTGGAWNLTGEGLVYDPDNDPFYAAAAGLAYPTGSPAQPYVGTDYGPQHLYRLYVTRNNTETNLITIKSGDMVIASTTIIGRSGSTVSAQGLGRVDHLGGRVRLPLTNLDIGETEASGWGQGVYNYQGGTLEVALEGGVGIRLAHGNSGASRGPSGVNRFIVGNGAAGHIRTWDFSHVSYRGSGTDGTFDPLFDPDGVTRGVATTEFQFQNGGTRPVQVGRNLTLNNGKELATGATLSSRLELTLDEAPSVDGGGVPIDLGLFDVNFDIGFGDNGGLINGFGDANNDAVVDDLDQIFANADGSALYAEGATVSALFGGTRYDWTISYTGDITWTDADNSVVNTISGAGTGTDVVLIGLGSEVVGLDGDYNGDGHVNAADYTVWRDGNSPDDTQAGYDLWAANYGAGTPLPSAASAIPEPSTVMLALVGLALAARRR